MGQLSEQLKNFLDSDEGKTFIANQIAHDTHVENIVLKYVEKFHSLSEEEKLQILSKLKEKYESTKYLTRFDPYNGPDYSLYYILERYAMQYCKKVVPYFDEDWCDIEKYDILGKYLLEVRNSGFGTDYVLYEIGNAVIPHYFPNKKYYIYRYGNELFATDSDMTMRDIINQIIEHQYEGYSYVVEGEGVYTIKPNGEIERI